MTRKGYLSDVSDDEWAFVAPYLTLMREDAPAVEHSLREVFNGLRYIVRTGIRWRMMPHGLPPEHTVYQQTQRWINPGMFGEMVHDLRMLMREIDDRMQQPRAAIFDSRTLQSTPEGGGRAAWDGHKRRECSDVYLAADTLCQLLAILDTPANEQDRAQVGELARQIQEVTGDSVEIAFVHQGYTGDKPAAAAEAHGVRLEVARLPTAKPRRWVAERSLGWMAGFRRLVHDYERLAEALAGLHFVASLMLLAHRSFTFMVEFIAGSSVARYTGFSVNNSTEQTPAAAAQLREGSIQRR